MRVSTLTQQLAEEFLRKKISVENFLEDYLTDRKVNVILCEMKVFTNFIVFTVVLFENW